MPAAILAWILNIVSHWSVKAIAIGLAISLATGGLFVGYKSIVNKAYNRGYQTALKDHPQNNYYGPTTVVQGKKMTCFPFHLGVWGFGVCHD